MGTISQAATTLVIHKDIDDLEIGGRNLLLKSATKKISGYKSPSLTFTTGVTVSEWGAKDAITVSGTGGTSTLFATLSGISASSGTSISGESYTFSIYIKNTGSTTLSITNNGLGGYKAVSAGECARVVLAGTGNGTNYVQFVFSTPTAGDSVEFTYWHPKIEYGNKATDWTPAPEDVDADVAEAAKIATNYMAYGDDGLIIGNNINGTFEGSRAQVLPSSFNILDSGGTALASFGGTTVIGYESKANLCLTFNKLYMKDKDSTEFFRVGDYRESDGVATLKYIGTETADSSGKISISVGVTVKSITSVTVGGSAVSSSKYSFSGSTITITGYTSGTEYAVVIGFTTSDLSPYLTFGTRNSSESVGVYSSTEGINLTANGYCSHAKGKGSTASGDLSYAEGDSTTASGYRSHAEGDNSVASGNTSHAEGGGSQAIALYSHAEGWNTYAAGAASHAEGRETRTSGLNSHAEGYNTLASGNYSHAEGYAAYATGECSHAEGLSTRASGRFSHAEGNCTKASSDYQHVCGRSNIEDADGKYAFIIGNGDDYGDSNAMTVDWDGRIWTGVPIPLNSMMVGCSSAKTLSTSMAKITCGNLYSSSGDLLQRSDGGIKCTVAGNVLVIATMYATSLTAGDAVQCAPYVNSSGTAGEYAQSGSRTYVSVYNIKAVTVSAGDIIYLYGKNGVGARGSIAADNTTTLFAMYLS